MILLSKKENDSTPKGGKVPIPLSKEQEIRCKSASNVTDKEHLRLHVKYDVQLKGLTAQEELLSEPAEVQPEYSRYLWDRPIPKPQFKWAYGPQMPSK